ncbi:ABC transporter ATP-binding protein [Clostridium sp. JNZ J1-5]|nr:ABC transporter ATP-binding protein [Clostridium sp.]
MANNILELKNVNKTFGGLEVIKDVNLELERNTFKTIIGPNGAGKTTLYNLISGAMKPTRGEIFFNGVNITGLPPHKITNMGLGRSYQVTNIFPNLTVHENIRIAAQSKGKNNFRILSDYKKFKEYIDIADEVIERVKLSGKGNMLAVELSHAEQRKLEIGIQLALGGELILLDEPTAGISLEEVPALIDVIESIKKLGNKSILLIEHKINIIMRISDTIAVLHGGVIIADDTPEKIKQNVAVQKAYLGGGAL